MRMTQNKDIYSAENWYAQGQGPRYRQLYRHILQAIQRGDLAPDSQLPPERDLATLADVSRVTVRKAVAQLVADGVIDQQRGAGSFVRGTPATARHQQSLSSLVSFSESMAARGKTSTSKVLQRGLFTPSPDEMMALGIAARGRVSRISRLRSANGIPMAIENSSLPEDILPRPDDVTTSLYLVLRRDGCAPIRAIQRVTAINAGAMDAEKLKLPEGAAVLSIERTAFLDNGRPIEFTRGLYRSDIYDFISELRLDGGN